MSDFAGHYIARLREAEQTERQIVARRRLSTGNALIGAHADKKRRNLSGSNDEITSIG